MSHKFTTKQVAESHHVSTRTVRRWIATGKLFAVQALPGGAYMIPDSEIAALDDGRLLRRNQPKRRRRTA